MPLHEFLTTIDQVTLGKITWSTMFNKRIACGGEQGYVSRTFSEVKARLHQLVLGWVTTRENRDL